LNILPSIHVAPRPALFRQYCSPRSMNLAFQISAGVGAGRQVLLPGPPEQLKQGYLQCVAASDVPCRPHPCVSQRMRGALRSRRRDPGIWCLERSRDLPLVFDRRLPRGVRPRALFRIPTWFASMSPILVLEHRPVVAERRCHLCGVGTIRIPRSHSRRCMLLFPFELGLG